MIHRRIFKEVSSLSSKFGSDSHWFFKKLAMNKRIINGIRAMVIGSIPSRIIAEREIVSQDVTSIVW